MATFKTVVRVGTSGPMEVVGCKYSFAQTIDDKGKPSSVVQGGVIEVTVVSTADDDNKALVTAAFDPWKIIDGSIDFIRGDQDSVAKTVSWKKGYCFAISEEFDARGREDQAAMLTTFKITAKEVTVNGVLFDAKWPMS